MITINKIISFIINLVHAFIQNEDNGDLFNDFSDVTEIIKNNDSPKRM